MSGRVAAIIATATLVGFSMTASASGGARASMHVSATVLPTSCIDGRSARACMQPVRSESRVERYEVATSAEAMPRKADLQTATGELVFVTLTY